MLKWIAGVLLVLNVLFFCWMQWGGSLTVEAGNPALQPELNAARVKIMSEAELATLAASATLPSGLQLAPAPEIALSASMVTHGETKPVCYSWGEFSGSDLRHAEQLLAEKTWADKVTREQVGRNHGFWVYIPPLKSRTLIDKKLQQLKEHGVTDYYVLQESGRWQNAISLGVFKTEAAANNYLFRLNNKGIQNASVGERESKLKFTVFTLSGITPEQLPQLKQLHNEFPESELKETPCGEH